ncbi:MAG: peroxiredoxin family protein [Actinomycetota bacterium]
MSPLAVGDAAPDIPGVSFGAGPVALFFYKVTCPTCQMAAPTMAAFELGAPGRAIGVGQDPLPELGRFSETYSIGIRSVEDPPPYVASDAYGIVSVPTLYLVHEGAVIDVVGAWDRDGFNRVAVAIARSVGAEPVPVSTPDDGLPGFKPG